MPGSALALELAEGEQLFELLDVVSLEGLALRVVARIESELIDRARDQWFAMQQD
jgi:hypothetical protein